MFNPTSINEDIGYGTVTDGGEREGGARETPSFDYMADFEAADCALDGYDGSSNTLGGDGQGIECRIQVGEVHEVARANSTSGDNLE